MAILARRVLRECYVFRCTDITACRVTRSVSLRLETVVNDLFSGHTSGMSGWIPDTRPHKFDLSKLAARHWDWYCQKADALFSPSRNLATPFVPRINIVKRQLVVLLDPKAQPCNPRLTTWCWQSYSLSPGPMTWCWHRYSLSLSLTTWCWQSYPLSPCPMTRRWHR